MTNAPATTTAPESYDWLIGRTIRSFDFVSYFDGKLEGAHLTGPRSCYKEGIVTKVEDGLIHFTVTRMIFEDEDQTNDPDHGIPVRGDQFRTPIKTWDTGNRLNVGAIQVIG